MRVPHRSPLASIPVDVALLRPIEVYPAFGISRTTLKRWANAGKLPSIRTLGGQRRYPAAPVRELLRAKTTPGDAR